MGLVRAVREAELEAVAHVADRLDHEEGLQALLTGHRAGDLELQGDGVTGNGVGPDLVVEEDTATRVRTEGIATLTIDEELGALGQIDVGEMSAHGGCAG